MLALSNEAKPYSKPKPKWLSLGGKRMTLIAGFHCQDGILLVADREEATATGKRSVSKIVPSFGFNGGEWALIVATAGHAATADLAVSALHQRIDDIHIDTL